MAEEDNKTLETVLTPLSPTEAGAPPKISPFSAPPAADPVAQPAPAPAAPAATASAAPTPAASPAPAPADAAAPAPAAAPAGTTTQRTTIRLKPVIRKPTIRKPMAPAARPPAMPAPAPKKTTSNLKSVTGPVPAQAILKKTGIVAEGILTPAQAQAAKSKTTRISLESAMGVAPAKETPAPLKTIRLRRPTDLKRPGPSPLKPATPAPAADAVSTKAETVIRGAAQAEASAPAAAPSLENQPTLLSISPAAPVSTEATTVVSEQDSGQKKTLKLHRPGISGRRPALGIKKPGAVSEPAAGAGDDVPELPSQTLVDDVPELKPLTAADFGAAPARELSAGVPKWVMTFSLITTIAAAAVIGFVAFLLVQEGCGPDAGENAMAFIQTN